MPQPNQDQVEAMSRLSPEDRQKTIRAMVAPSTALRAGAKMRETPDTSPEARDARDARSQDQGSRIAGGPGASPHGAERAKAREPARFRK